MTNTQSQAQGSNGKGVEPDEKKIIDSDKLVFVFGIYSRTGTNFIGRILTSHKEICRPQGHWELPILDVSDQYLNFFYDFDARREPGRLNYGIKDFCRIFGEGMLQLMYDRVEVNKDAKYIVQKNPGTIGLENFRLFFPNAKLIILTRDGKDVMNSYLSASYLTNQKFNPKRYYIGLRFCLNFRNSILRILDFISKQPENTILIRYEDLTNNLQPSLYKIAEFLEIEPYKEWQDACINLTVKGSNFYNKADDVGGFVEKGNGTNWQEQKKTESFKPIGRYKKFLNFIDLLIFSLVVRKPERSLEKIEL